MKPTDVPYFDAKWRMPDPQEILCYCSSLVVVVSGDDHSYKEGDSEDDGFDQDDGSFEDINDGNKQLQLAHFSVKEYLTSDWLQEDIAQEFEEVAAKASIAKSLPRIFVELGQRPFGKYD